MVNIRSHVSVTLNLAESNYTHWRCFFDTVFGKFSIRDHIDSLARRSDPEWLMINHSIVNWLYTTVSREVLEIILQPDSTAYFVWRAIEGIFRNNRLTQAIYIEAGFRSLYQGDMAVTQYCNRLKTLADNLCDIGQPVNEENQVLNMLRGLTPKFQHVIPVLTAKDPLPDFIGARSYIILEEKMEVEQAHMAAAQALYAGHALIASTYSSWF